MAVSIKRSNGDLLWFDAVTSFSQKRVSNVTKNPISKGSPVSDHISSENLVFSLSAVISQAAFHLDSPVLTDEQRAQLDTTRTLAVGYDPIEPIIVSTNQQSSIISALPESISQFLDSDLPPSVEVQSSRANSNILLNAKSVLTTLSDGTRKLIPGGVGNYRTIFETFTLVVWGDNNSIEEVYPNCVLTGLDFTENPDSGYAIYPMMTIVQTNIVPLIEGELPEKVTSALATKAAATQDQGKKQGEFSEDSIAATEDNAKEEPTELTSGLFKLGVGEP